MPVRLGVKQHPRRADARIHYHQMDGVWREIAVGGFQHEGRLRNVLGVDRMADVDQHGLGIDSQDHGLHEPGIFVPETEIRDEADDRHQKNLCWTLNPRCR